jgi:hypothetical protein
MTAKESPIPVRERIKDLNTKAYYLLVALSFIYGSSHGSRFLKCAISLTALSAVLPVQDYLNSKLSLEIMRALKVCGLILALICTLWWVWTASA